MTSSRPEPPFRRREEPALSLPKGSQSPPAWRASQTAPPPELSVVGCHPERSRLSGEEKDLVLHRPIAPAKTPNQISAVVTSRVTRYHASDSFAARLPPGSGASSSANPPRWLAQAIPFHSLVGDPLYSSTGQPLENLPGLPGDGGYFLHAQFLNFQHPITGEQINLEA